LDRAKDTTAFADRQQIFLIFWRSVAVLCGTVRVRSPTDDGLNGV
jgi:hypothetical protein